VQISASGYFTREKLRDTAYLPIANLAVSANWRSLVALDFTFPARVTSLSTARRLELDRSTWRGASISWRPSILRLRERSRWAVIHVDNRDCLAKIGEGVKRAQGVKGCSQFGRYRLPKLGPVPCAAHGGHTCCCFCHSTTRPIKMSTAKQLRVALAQTCPESAKEGEYPSSNVDPLQVLRTNLADCAEFVKKAKDGGAEVVCFAEYYLQGILNEGRQVTPLQYPGFCAADVGSTYRYPPGISRLVSRI
jgi:hypothetical protein